MACGGCEPSVCSSTDIDVINAEMATLKAQLRVLDAERRAYILQSQDQIRKQRCEIEHLQATQMEVQSSLRVCESHTHRQRDADDIQNLLIALEHRDEIDKLLETERLTLEQLDKEILSVEHRLLSKWKMESTRGNNQRLTQKTAQILENDLNRCVIQFDTYLAQNSKLREDMESLHIRRIKFQQIRQRMEEELEEVRRDIRGVVKLCTEAHDDRVEVQVILMKMKDMAIKDLADYDNEMKEMETIINQEHDLQEFLMIKCHDRSGGEDYVPQLHAINMWEIRQELSDEILIALEDTFLQIHNFTGEADLNVMVKRFLKIEDGNRALRDHVSKQDDEAEALKHQISQMQQDIEQLHENYERKSTDHHVLLEDLQVLRQDTESMTLENKTKAVTVTKTLDKVRTGMRRVLRRLERQRNVMRDVMKGMPSSSGITNHNLLDVLARMDEKISKLMSIKSFLDFKNPVKDGSKAAAVIPTPEASAKAPSASGTEGKKKKQPPTQKELRQQMIREILLREGVIWPGRKKVVKTSSSQPRPEA